MTWRYRKREKSDGFNSLVVRSLQELKRFRVSDAQHYSIFLINNSSNLSKFLTIPSSLKCLGTTITIFLLNMSSSRNTCTSFTPLETSKRTHHLNLSASRKALYINNHRQTKQLYLQATVQCAAGSNTNMQPVATSAINAGRDARKMSQWTIASAIELCGLRSMAAFAVHAMGRMMSIIRSLIYARWWDRIGRGRCVSG